MDAIAVPETAIRLPETCIGRIRVLRHRPVPVEHAGAPRIGITRRAAIREEHEAVAVRAEARVEDLGATEEEPAPILLVIHIAAAHDADRVALRHLHRRRIENIRVAARVLPLAVEDAPVEHRQLLCRRIEVPLIELTPLAAGLPVHVVRHQAARILEEVIIVFAVEVPVDQHEILVVMLETARADPPVPGPVGVAPLRQIHEELPAVRRLPARHIRLEIRVLEELPHPAGCARRFLRATFCIAVPCPAANVSAACADGEGGQQRPQKDCVSFPVLLHNPLLFTCIVFFSRCTVLSPYQMHHARMHRSLSDSLSMLLLRHRQDLVVTQLHIAEAYKNPPYSNCTVDPEKLILTKG